MPRRATIASALASALLACGAPPPPDAGPRPRTEAVEAVDIPDLLARIAREPEGPGRRPLMQQIRRAPADAALPALRTALAAADPTLRAAAASATSRRSDGKQLAPQLLTLATTDTAVPVRIAAIRSLGQLRQRDAFPALQQNLSHETAEIRVAALRALARIDAARASTLPELGRLQLDPDARVAGVATKVARGVALQ